MQIKIHRTYLDSRDSEDMTFAGMKDACKRLKFYPS